MAVSGPSLASRVTDSVLGQFLWAVWRAKWHQHRFFSEFLFSPVSIIPPLLHTHPSIYHPRCMLSQHVSFPCQYNSTNSPVSVSFHQLSPVISFHQLSPVSIIPPTLPCQYQSTNSPSQYHSTNSPLSISFHQLFPVSIIPSTLHTHSDDTLTV
jgi:hypothetical protein